MLSHCKPDEMPLIDGPFWRNVIKLAYFTASCLYAKAFHCEGFYIPREKNPRNKESLIVSFFTNVEGNYSLPNEQILEDIMDF